MDEGRPKMGSKKISPKLGSTGASKFTCILSNFLIITLEQDVINGLFSFGVYYLMLILGIYFIVRNGLA